MRDKVSWPRNSASFNDLSEVSFTIDSPSQDTAQIKFLQRNDSWLGHPLRIERDGDQATLVDTVTNLILASAIIPAAAQVRVTIVVDGNSIRHELTQSL